MPPGLATEWILDQFAGTRAIARRRYAKFVHEGIGVPGPWEEVKGQMLLGSEAFVERLAPQLQGCSTAEIPKRQRLVHRPSLKTLLAGADSRTVRNDAMARAYLTHGYTLTEISRAVGLHYATISRIITALEKTSKYTMHSERGDRIQLISARLATKAERRIYEEEACGAKVGVSGSRYERE